MEASLPADLFVNVSRVSLGQSGGYAPSVCQVFKIARVEGEGERLRRQPTLLMNMSRVGLGRSSSCVPTLSLQSPGL